MLLLEATLRFVSAGIEGQVHLDGPLVTIVLGQAYAGLETRASAVRVIVIVCAFDPVDRANQILRVGGSALDVAPVDARIADLPLPVHAVRRKVGIRRIAPPLVVCPLLACRAIAEDAQTVLTFEGKGGKKANATMY